MLSHFSHVALFATPWTVTCQAPLSMGLLQLSQCVMVLSHINLATGIPSSKVKYSRLSSTDDGYIDFQFKKSPPKIPCKAIVLATVLFFFFFSFTFTSWRLITLQYCSGFCHTLTWISHGFTCIPHPDPLSHFPLHLIPLGLPSTPAPSTCLMHPTWAGDLFHPR